MVKFLYSSSILIAALVSPTAPITSPSAVVSSSPFPIPAENSDAVHKPDFSNAQVLARDLVAALAGSDDTAFAKLFFPRDIFLRLKNLPNPARYYDQLMDEYRRDVRRIVTGIGDHAQLSLIDFKPGFCRWKPIDSEYNHIAYWSCYRSTLKISLIAKTTPTDCVITIPVRTIINWADHWFITHLGTVPALSRDCPHIPH